MNCNSSFIFNFSSYLFTICLFGFLFLLIHCFFFATSVPEIWRKCQTHISTISLAPTPGPNYFGLTTMVGFDMVAKLKRGSDIIGRPKHGADRFARLGLATMSGNHCRSKDLLLWIVIIVSLSIFSFFHKTFLWLFFSSYSLLFTCHFSILGLAKISNP